MRQGLCIWKEVESLAGFGEYYWETSCEDFIIIDGDSPLDINWRFCPYCGREIKEIRDD